ncbi:hypothetical protein GPM19_05005 [Halomonas sp. ZH2S]|uniref:Uncharacterized protein n=1 Tax=Vreelandella zhuhanensis TaxID=2684210 RepID=A0A7X3GZ69_9GAMM|nr:hypothetical protein [Halomonas zhuhanensis]MWJ27572.1 hypothetical protein [Halomonas zhuhanensis]
MKHILKAAALVGTFSLLSGMAVAEQPGEDIDPNGGVDSANDPTDVPYDPEARGEVNPDEPVLDPEGGVDSANDPDDAMIDPQSKVENGEVVPDSGVDSANDPDD